jgi:hypothetical protein
MEPIQDDPACPVCGDDHDWQRHPTCYPRYLSRRVSDLVAERDRLRDLLAKEHDVEDGVSHERDAEYPDEVCDLLFGTKTTEEE